MSVICICKLSDLTEKGLTGLNAFLCVEMKLHFSCMVRKMMCLYQSILEGQEGCGQMSEYNDCIRSMMYLYYLQNNDTRIITPGDRENK